MVRAEDDATMTEEDRAVARFQKQRIKELSGTTPLNKTPCVSGICPTTNEHAIGLFDGHLCPIIRLLPGLGHALALPTSAGQFGVHRSNRTPVGPVETGLNRIS